MKTTVSIPDDLWASAQESFGGKGGSALVQQALSDFVSDCIPEPRIEPQLDPETRFRMGEVRERLRQERHESFYKGYKMGVALAEQLSWAEVTYAVDMKMSFILLTKFVESEENAAELEAGQPDAVACDEIAQRYIEIAPQFDERTDADPIPDVVRGIETALEDLHNDVVNATDW